MCSIVDLNDTGIVLILSAVFYMRSQLKRSRQRGVLQNSNRSSLACCLDIMNQPRCMIRRLVHDRELILQGYIGSFILLKIWTVISRYQARTTGFIQCYFIKINVIIWKPRYSNIKLLYPPKMYRSFGIVSARHISMQYNNFNPSRPSEAYMRQKMIPSLVQIMEYCL